MQLYWLGWGLFQKTRGTARVDLMRPTCAALTAVLTWSPLPDAEHLSMRALLQPVQLLAAERVAGRHEQQSVGCMHCLDIDLTLQQALAVCRQRACHSPSRKVTESAAGGCALA